MGVTELVFAVELQKVLTKCIFLDFLREDWGEFQNRICERGKKVLKNPFLQNLHRDISFRTQCDKENVEMKDKIRTSLTSTIEVPGEEVELSNTRAYCFRYAHSQHTESHLGNKPPQAKIPIAFLFSKLHFNIVTKMLFFYGGHLLIRSKRCAVQSQRITLT